MSLDFFMGGRGYGGVAQTLIANGMDTDALRPFIGPDNRSYVWKKNPSTGKREPQLTANAATLLPDQWKMVDDVVYKVAKPMMRAVTDLRSRGLTKTIDAMKTTVLAYNRMSDMTRAKISMDGISKSERDRPTLDQAYLPIPLIHKDLSFTAREIGASQNPGWGGGVFHLDTESLTIAATKCAEEAEQLLIGSAAMNYYYGGGTVYGYTTFPGRITKTFTLPTAVGWTPGTLVAEFLGMIQSLKDAYHRGPYIVYMSSDWDTYLDDDYSATYNGDTLRTRLLKIAAISSIETLDFLNGFQAIFLQPSADVVEMVVGMEFRTLQWAGDGDMSMNYKIIGSFTPRFRQDQNGNSGIGHAVAA